MTLRGRRCLGLCAPAQVDALAAESGWSFVVMASGAGGGALPSGRPGLHVEAHRSEELGGAEVQVGVLHHGVGTSGECLAGKEELLQLAAGLHLYHLEQTARPRGPSTLRGLLHSLGLGHLEPALEAAGLSAAGSAHNVTDEALAAAGIPAGPRRRLLLAALPPDADARALLPPRA